jgi:hypothetical protein
MRSLPIPYSAGYAAAQKVTSAERRLFAAVISGRLHMELSGLVVGSNRRRPLRQVRRTWHIAARAGSRHGN